MVKNNGHIFEEEFKKSIPFFIYSKKLKVAQFYKNGGNEGDYLVYYKPNLFIFELKSHLGKSIPFEALRENQIKGLVRVKGNIDGAKVGFIFNFRDLEETFYLSAYDVANYMETADRKSFPIEWVREQGIKIEQERIRVRYRYNISKLLQDICEEELY